jgi:hypothetical protein
MGCASSERRWAPRLEGDAHERSVENVSHSFLRRQVNSDSGSVNVSGRTVTVASESPGVTIREHYHVADRDNFVYRLDVSNDGGKSWNKGQIEMTFRRSSFS